jgi:palmitoyl-protein thioesterase
MQVHLILSFLLFLFFGLTQDKLGLKKMDEQGKLVFLTSDTDHLQFTESWFEKNLIPYIK